LFLDILTFSRIAGGKKARKISFFYLKISWNGSIADKHVEEYRIGKTQKNFLDHGVFGEETGTTSFIYNLQYYSVSIALQKNSKTIDGTVCASLLNELFWPMTGFLPDQISGLHQINLRSAWNMQKKAESRG